MPTSPPPKPPSPSAQRSPWLLASLMATVASLLAACKSAPEAPLPGSQWPAGFVASPPSNASTPRQYRQDAAQHLYALNAQRIYQGKLPASLYAVGVLEADIDPRGHVTRLKWKRAPQHAPEVIAEIERTVRAAAPFPLPTQLGRVTYTETWLWDQQGQFQLDTLTEGQL